MELPITKPSKVCYADELIFSELLEQMAENRHNGFIRITHGSEEGYILFREGKEVAAAYDRFLKSAAIEQIELSFEKSDTLIEVFDLKESQMDYLIDLNQVYKLEEKPPEPVSLSPETYSEPEKIVESEEKLFNPKEASYRKSADSLREEMELQYAEHDKSTAESEIELAPSNEVSVKETAVETENVEAEKPVEPKSVEQKPAESKPVETANADESLNKEGPVSESVVEETIPEMEVADEKSSVSETIIEEESSGSENVVEEGSISESEPIVEEENSIPEEEPEVKTEIEETTPAEIEDLSQSKTPSDTTEITEVSENETIVEEVEEEPEIPMDRSDLLKKYGLRDIDEEEVDKVLETYKGGFVSTEDIEKIELTLMNKIKKSVMSIPRISGTEVMVFLENAQELTGKIKIITIYEGKGFLSRIRGESKDIQNLRFQITDITEMEIRKSFRDYPQIVDNFDIDIEIH
jgi:hypothetical protein